MPKIKYKTQLGGIDAISIGSKSLPDNDLPTLRDVLSYVSLLESEGHKRGLGLYNLVAKKLMSIYHEKNPSLSMMLPISIANKIKNSQERLFLYQTNANTSFKKRKFFLSLDELFEILKCRCHIPNKGDLAETISKPCDCDPTDKIPDDMVEFIYEQRQRGINASLRSEKVPDLARVHDLETIQPRVLLLKEKPEENVGLSITKKEVFPKTEEEREEDPDAAVSNCDIKNEVFYDIEEETEDTDAPTSNGDIKNEVLDETQEFPDQESSSQSINKVNNLPARVANTPLNLPTVAREALCRSMSNQDVAAIVAATLVDFGLVSPNNPSIVVDEHVVQRAKDKYHPRELVVVATGVEPKLTNVTGVYFETVRSVEGLEYIMLVNQPDARCLTCFNTATETVPMRIAKVIIQYLTQHNIINDLLICGADLSTIRGLGGMNLLTIIENQRGRPVHRVICGLNALELSMQRLYDVVAGPNSAVEGLLANVDDLMWSDSFPPIIAGPPMPKLDDLSVLPNDLRYLYLAATAIRNGRTNRELSKVRVGPSNRTRWLPQACRICRLYMSHHSLHCRDLKKLNDLTYYIVTNFAVLWIEQHLEPHFSQASVHLLRQINLMRPLPSSTRATVTPLIPACNAHPENLLIALLCDEDPAMRKFGVEQILKIRQTRNPGSSDPRTFQAPRLNPAAKCLPDLIDWSEEPLYESILTQHLSNDDIQQIETNRLCLPPYPNHNRFVESMSWGASNSCIDFST